ncbi:MAG: hypothetical protein HJJLKODD_00689 [Phycisphaerae bacterium]|nr:hypothetical protein [Phycisphaerae bacterium]
MKRNCLVFGWLFGIIFTAAPLAAQQPPASQPTDREAELEALVRDLANRVDALEKRLSETQQALEQAQNGNTAGAVENSSSGTPTSQPAGDLESRIAKLEEQSNQHPNPVDVFWKEGLRLESKDGMFKLKVGGRVHLDGAIMDADDNAEERGLGDLEDGVEFRRAWIVFSGDMYKNAFFKLEYDLAQGDTDFLDVYMGIKDVPWLGRIQAGHFREPMGLEMLTNANYLTFMERATPTESFAPNRNTGVQVSNTFLDQRATWALGGFVETDNFGDGQFRDGRNVTGRLTALPFYEDEGRRYVHLGLSYSRKYYQGDRREGDHLARFRSRPESHLAQRFIDTGPFYANAANILGAEAVWTHGPFSLQGEYFHDWVEGTWEWQTAEPSFYGFYVQASYFLTGEHRPYEKETGLIGRVKPLKNFREDGGWGAWEVAGRYSMTDLHDAHIDGDRLNDLTFGLNWYLNPNMRVMFNYIYADTEDFGNAHIYQMRLAFDF